MALKAKIVLLNNQGHDPWIREMTLPIPPFPGLGIRIDTYEMLNVDRVAIGDDGYDILCLVSPEGGKAFPAKACKEFGFQQIADDLQSPAFPQNLLSSEAMQERAKRADKSVLKANIVFGNDEGFWAKTMEIPFPPFVGLEIHLDGTKILTVWSVVIGDSRHDVTCLAQNKGAPFTSAECEILGFEEAVYP